MSSPAKAKPVKLLKPGPGEVWYFAFGSNLNLEVLTGRRKVVPRQSVPVKLDGYVLSFNYRGVPYSEPGFATLTPFTASDRARLLASAPQGQAITPASPPTTAAEAHRMRCMAGLHGVIHLISAEDWEKTKVSEGVMIQGIGYQVVKVTCETYDGQKVPSETLIAAPLSIGNPNHYLPSKRYMEIIREGAKQLGVDPAYQAMLDMHPYFDMGETWRLSLGRSIMNITALTLAAPLFPPMLLTSTLNSIRQWWTGQKPHADITPGAEAIKGIPTHNGADKSPSKPQANGSAASSSAVVNGEPKRVTTAMDVKQTRPPRFGLLLMWMREHLPRSVVTVSMYGIITGTNMSHNLLWQYALGSGIDNPRPRRQTAAASAAEGKKSR